MSDWAKQGDLQTIGNHASFAVIYLAWFVTIDRIASTDLAQVIANIDRPRGIARRSPSSLGNAEKGNRNY